MRSLLGKYKNFFACFECLAVMGCDVYGHMVCYELCLRGIFCHSMCYGIVYMGVGFLCGVLVGLATLTFV